jgi:hypothetical protein
MSADKNTIGVTQENREFLELVIEQGLFSDQMDAAKLGMTLAIRRGIHPGEATGVDTKWNVGSFDKDGHLRDVLRAIYPEISTPIRLAEYLVNEGLVILRKQMMENPGLDIEKLQGDVPDGGEESPQ